MVEPVIIGDCKLYQGDCLEIMPTLPRVDAVVTDPPYGTQNLAGGYGRRQLHDTGDGMGRTIQNDDDLSLFSRAAKLLPIDTGFVAVFLSSRMWPEFIEASAPLKFFGEIIWAKKQMGLGFHIRYAHESIAVFRQGEPPRPADAIGSVIECHQLEKLHPHQKPVELLHKLVGWCSAWGGASVLDPFMGSGTTLAACARLGRAGIGIELEPEYFDLACRRVERAYAQPDFFTEVTPEATQEGMIL